MGKTVFVLLFFLIFIVSVGFVYGYCCKFEGEGLCRAQTDCSGGTLVGIGIDQGKEPCSLHDECKQGCCCYDNTSSYKFTCPSDFREYLPMPDDENCKVICGATYYTVTGSVLNATNSQVMINALVSDSISGATVSAPSGTYSINLRSGVSHTLTAIAGDCKGTVTIPNPPSSYNQNILVNCTCQPTYSNCRYTCDCSIPSNCVYNWTQYICENSCIQKNISRETKDCCNGQCFSSSSCPDGYAASNGFCNSGICCKSNSEQPSPRCGNGNTDLGEECDDGNTNNCDSCSNTCTRITGCGDGVLCGSEECDDGNKVNGDGCSSTCTIEQVSSNCGNHVCDTGEDCKTCSADCLPTPEVNVCCGTPPTVYPGECCVDSDCASGEKCDATHNCISNCDGVCNAPEECSICKDECANNPFCVCSATAAIINLQIVDVPEAHNLSLSWNFAEGCSPLTQFKIERCDKASPSCLTADCTFVGVGTVDNKTVSFMDSGLTNRTAYYYKIIAQLEDGSVVNASKCEVTGDEECLNPHPAKWCRKNDKLSCTDTNILQLHLCTNGTCVVNADGTTQCVAQGPCDDCNGLFGMYAYLNLGFYFKPLDQDLTCAELESGDFRLCYKDYTDQIVDKYYYCSNVTSCYDYQSKDTCEGDPCRKFSTTDNNCSWTDINTELGLGVCRPDNVLFQECHRCTEEYSLAGCTDDVCNAFGDCYNDQLPNERAEAMGCINKAEMACRYYDDEKDCNGGNSAGDVQVDVTWSDSPPNKKTGGTNKITSASKDILGLKKCEWSDKGFCIKNSDNFPASQKVDDCVLTGLDLETCYKDVTPPVTQIINTQNQGRNNLIFDYIVSDDVYSSVKTWFSYNSSHYPDKSLADVKRDLKTSSEDLKKNWTISYFSEDPAMNLEEIQSATIWIDGKAPNVTKFTGEPFSYDVGNDVWRTDLTISFNTDESAYCKGILGSSDQNRTQSNKDIASGPATTFSTKYVALEDDNSYYFTITCLDKYGNEYSEVRDLPIAGDMSIRNPLPNGTTLNYTSVVLSIDAGSENKTATECRYSETTTEFNSMSATFTSDPNNSTHYKASPTLSNNGKVYIYHTACEFDDGSITQGNKGDDIIFAIDKQAPNTNYSLYPPEWSLEKDVVLTCNDPQIKRSTDRDWAFDNCIIYFKFSSEPDSKFRIYQTNEVYHLNISNANQNLNVYSIDSGGNREATQTIDLKIKNTTFAVPEITVYLPSS